MIYSSIVDGWYRFRCPDCGEPLRFSCHVSLGHSVRFGQFVGGVKTGEVCSHCDSRVVIIAGEEPYLQREGPPGPNQKKSFRHSEKKKDSVPEPEIHDESFFEKVLKLQGPYGLDQVRQAYKAQMKQYHPDQVDHLGEELKALANKKSKEINAAFEFFCKKFGD